MSSSPSRPVRRALVTAVCTLALTSAAAWARTPGDLVAEQRAQGAAFARVAPFGVAKAAAIGSVREVVRNGSVFKLDTRAVATLERSRPSTMSLELPHQSGPVVLELVRVEPFALGFQARTDAGVTVPRETLGEHYRGVLEGEPGSLAAISFLGDEVMGQVWSKSLGNLVLGRLGGVNPSNQHILYAESALIPKHGFVCGTADEGASNADEVISYFDATRQTKSFDVSTKDVGDTVRIYVEVDNDIYKDKGAGAGSYVSGLFNQSATIYSNESIPIAVSEMVIWTKKSPYNGNSSSALLSSFQRKVTSFNGDLGHLISYRGGGGIAAGFNGFCNADRSQSQCFSGIASTYNNVPTYSWTVMVFTHEMGHLMGSRHTHACVWNGNNTQIDGCYTPEGTCPNVGYPSGGGTVMSYCHLSGRPGINFSNGFGPQPGNVIRSRYAAASCLSP